MSQGAPLLLNASTWKTVLGRLRETPDLGLDEAAWRRAEALSGAPRELDEMATALGLERQALLRGWADAENMPYVDLTGITPAPGALSAVSETVVRRYACLPLFLNGRELTVAVGEATWTKYDRLLQELANWDVILVLADAIAIADSLDLAYPSALESEMATYLALDGTTGVKLKAVAERAPVVRMLQAILERAVRRGASDIHIEPQAHASRVRVRVDGLLEDAYRFEPALHEAIVSRLKVLSDLNISDRLRPQDGRFAFEACGRTIEARLSTLRTVHGEKVVMRLMGHASGAHAGLAGLGMAEGVLARFKALLDQPYGMVLVTGPTGSGKTSTLYAALRHLTGAERNVVSLEDPVESQLTGINQVPMRPEVDLTFASALRAVLRQDPDVVMVGEVRDQETANIALRAALTGHLVLTTLHANDAAETIARLLEMGLAPSHVSPALLGVVAQRMVRRLCTCHTYRTATPLELDAVGLAYLGPDVVLPAPRGCLACGQTGFSGRQALFELLEVDNTMRGLIQREAPADELRRAGLAAGMQTLWTAGLREVLAGHTTLDEVRRVVRRTD